MIAISFDIDWAPDDVIEDTLDLLDSVGVHATLFATHGTSILNSVHNHEICIHPNFLGTNDYLGELDRLITLYPQARGVRCHSYFQSTQILDLFVERGLQYDSNLLMFGYQNIRAFMNWNGLVRLPVFWEDDVNCIVGGTWDPGMLSLSDPNSLYVFNFHPIHIYLNTENRERYAEAKSHYHDPVKLREFINPESSLLGARVFLKKLLALITEEYAPLTLGEIAESLFAELNNGHPCTQP